MICSILGAVINCGGGRDEGYIGGKYWRDPGAFRNGFKGFCNILVTAAFSFAGTELVGLAAAETHNPSKALPTAIKQVFWRIALVSTYSLLVKMTFVLTHPHSFILSLSLLLACSSLILATSSSVATLSMRKHHRSSLQSETLVSKA
jgi:amino acid transporter